MRPRTLLLALAVAAGGIAGCGSDHNSTGEFEYVAMGASDAVGIGASPLTNGYVYLIQDALKQDGRDVGLLNLGIPGAETDEVQNLELPVAVDDEPELVTVFTGVNDVIAGIGTEDFRNDFGEIAETLANETNALVVIANIPDLTTLPKFREDPDPDVTLARIGAFNAIIAEECAKYGIPVVDAFSANIQDFQVSDDGFHPNDAGHRLLADLFIPVIRANLPPPA